MARYVIDCSSTLRLASASSTIAPEDKLFAPTLWRSEVLSAVYQAVRRNELSEDDARERLDYANALTIRLLGDLVLRRRAFELARDLDLETTYAAEYVALAQLQKCTLVSADAQLLERVGDLVPTATVEALA